MRSTLRYVLSATGFFVLLFVSFYRWHGDPRFQAIWTYRNRAYLYKGRAAEDKVIVIAKMHNESVDWVTEGLPDWQQAIYHMDAPEDGILHPPLNKGREAMAYLTFLIDHYHNLPSIMVFLHPHKDTWPTAWHNDAPDYSNVRSVQDLRLSYVHEHGYANMRCIHEPGCPNEVLVHREIKDEHEDVERAMRDVWTTTFFHRSNPQKTVADIPPVIAQPCCSQFSVSRTQVHRRELADYQRYRHWLIATNETDDVSGRVMEYLWHIIFGRDPVYCPDFSTCRCEQFGDCL